MVDYLSQVSNDSGTTVAVILLIVVILVGIYFVSTKVATVRKVAAPNAPTITPPGKPATPDQFAYIADLAWQLGQDTPARPYGENVRRTIDRLRAEVDSRPADQRRARRDRICKLVDLVADRDLTGIEVPEDPLTLDAATVDQLI